MNQVLEGIIFITVRKDHDPLIYRSTKIQVTDNVNLLDSYLAQKSYAGLDCETNGSRLYISDILLLQIGDNSVQFVIDCTVQSLLQQVVTILQKHIQRLLYFGHNIKFDRNILARYGVFLPRICDTMILEQRINLGRTDMTANLEDVFGRRLNKFMDTDKRIRTSFLKMNLRSTFHITQIVYGAKDIGGLEDIARIQRGILQEYNQYNWVRDVEFPLVTVLSDMELEGMYLYDDKWQDIITKKKHAKLDIERKLDIIVTKLTKIRYDKPRNKATTTILDLFGGSNNVDNQNTKHLNYSSSAKMLKIIQKTGEPVPMIKLKGVDPRPSMMEPALLQYLIEKPKTKLKEFLRTYIDYKEAEKFINSYGVKFLNERVRTKTGWKWGYKNSVTKRVHTIYKPCSTDTGRLASGDADAGYYNSQQIPAKKEIRVCFGLSPEEIAEGYWITTCDLSGAELIIMAALADDQHLYELGADKIINGVKVEGDLHSPLATKSWRAVYTHRKNRFIDNHGQHTWDTASIEKLNEYFTIWDTDNKPYILTEDIVIDRSTNKQLRTDFKRMGFGVVYGLKDNKGAQTLNIPKDEAKVVINVISREIPKTIKMVENAAVCALADGYVIFNSRSNNRRWFTPVLNIIDKFDLHKVSREERYYRVKKELSFAELSDIEGAARNCRIQGTQSDMIKEAMVLTHQTLRRRDLKSGLLLSVHDELAAKHKDKEYGSEIAKMMTDTANLYLAPYSENIRMRSEHHTLTTWIK